MAISAEFTADFTQYTEAARGAQDALEGVKKSADTVANIAVEEQARKAGRAFKELGSEVVDFAKDYLEAYAEEEAATARLTQALANQGNASASVIQAYEDIAQQFQQTTRYSDDAARAAETVFTQIGKVGPEQMKPAVQAAADLARGLGIDLESAATMMAKAIGSGGEKLGQLKRILGEDIEKGASFDEIMAAINSRFGGQAAADIETTEGKLARLGNQLADFKDRAGAVIANALTPLLDAFSSLPQGVQTVIVGVVALGTALAPIAIAFGSVVSAIAPLVVLIGGAGGLIAMLSGLVPFLLPAGAILVGIIAIYEAWKHWDAIVGVIKSVYDAVKRWLVDGFNALVGDILHPIQTVEGAFHWLYDKVVGHSYVPDLVNDIGEQFARLDDLMVAPAEAAAAATADAFDTAQQAALQLPSSPFKEVQDAFGGWWLALKSTGELVERLQAKFGTGGYMGMGVGGLGLGWTPRMNAAAAGVTINVQGSVLSTRDELARLVGDALTESYRMGGNRLPV